MSRVATATMDWPPERPDRECCRREKEESTSLLACLLAIALGVPLTVWEAFVMLKLWAWFGAPEYPDVKVPGLGTTAGLIVLFQAARWSAVDPIRRPKSGHPVGNIFLSVFVMAFLLGLGYVIKLVV